MPNTEKVRGEWKQARAVIRNLIDHGLARDATHDSPAMYDPGSSSAVQAYLVGIYCRIRYPRA